MVSIDDLLFLVLKYITHPSECKAAAQLQGDTNHMWVTSQSQKILGKEHK